MPLTFLWGMSPTWQFAQSLLKSRYLRFQYDWKEVRYVHWFLRFLHDLFISDGGPLWGTCLDLPYFGLCEKKDVLSFHPKQNISVMILVFSFSINPFKKKRVKNSIQGSGHTWWRQLGKCDCKSVSRKSNRQSPTPSSIEAYPGWQQLLLEGSGLKSFQSRQTSVLSHNSCGLSSLQSSHSLPKQSRWVPLTWPDNRLTPGILRSSMLA